REKQAERERAERASWPLTEAERYEELAQRWERWADQQQASAARTNPPDRAEEDQQANPCEPMSEDDQAAAERAAAAARHLMEAAKADRPASVAEMARPLAERRREAG